MDLFDILKYILIPVVLCYIGFNEKDKSMIKTKVDKSLPKDDIERLIDLKMKVHQVQIQDIKEDLNRIESKLDLILNKLAKR